MVDLTGQVIVNMLEKMCGIGIMTPQEKIETIV